MNRQFSEDRGATAVEYALIAAAIAAVIVGIVLLLGTNTVDLFSELPAEWKP